jgi:two-component system response regulator
MFAAPADQTIDILLVEDNPGDVRLTDEALKSAKVANRLHNVRNGEAAMKFLTRREDYADAPRPHIVLLDLNLPQKDGSQVLQEIKSNDDLRSIPVIILSTSNDPTDIAMSYAHHANCYVRKPLEMAAFHDVVRKIDEFWFSIARLPKA